MKAAIALALPSLLVAGTASAQPVGYYAFGDSPHWTLVIEHGAIRYDDRHGAVITPTQGVRPSFNGERYQTRKITVDVTHVPCTAADGRIFHDRVIVETATRRVEGCGGDVVTRDNPARPPLGHGPGVASLDGSAWTITSVDGVPAATARKTSIRFAHGRVEGNAGCNSFGGNYDQRGPVLNASQIISTKMACVGPGQNIENTVFRILEGPAQLSFRGSDTLMISNAGSRMTLNRAR